MSDMRNLYRAYSAVHNSEISQVLTESKDHISEMTFGQLNTADLQELAEEILEDMFEGGWTIYECADIITDILVEASEQSQSELKDQKIECIGEAFTAALDNCHTIEKFTQYRRSKSIKESQRNRSNTDLAAKRLHEAVIAPEKQEIKYGIIEMINDKIALQELDVKGAKRMDAAKPKKKVDVFAYDRKIGKKTLPDGRPLPPAPKNEARAYVDAYASIYEKSGSKPDYLDFDKDGNKDEPMKKALKDKNMNPAKKEEKLRKDNKLFGAPMKEDQGYNARLDDSMGAKHGKKHQSKKDRRDESEGMEKSKGKRKFSGDKSMDEGMGYNTYGATSPKQHASQMKKMAGASDRKKQITKANRATNTRLGGGLGEGYSDPAVAPGGSSMKKKKSYDPAADKGIDNSTGKKVGHKVTEASQEPAVAPGKVARKKRQSYDPAQAKGNSDRIPMEALTWSKDEIEAINAKIAGWQEEGPAFPYETKAQAKAQGDHRKGKSSKGLKTGKNAPNYEASRTSGANRQD